jgi:hypothetical protein
MSKELNFLPEEYEEAKEKESSKSSGDGYMKFKEGENRFRILTKPVVGWLWWVDSDGNICVIEMKNITVDSNIIPQVLKYAFWAETNPDSIKSLWLECENKPEDITISWDNYDIRIIVLAPEILKSTLDIVNKINYAVDLIEVKRWKEGDNHLILVNQLAKEQKIPSRPSSGLEIYDEAFYTKNYNK